MKDLTKGNITRLIMAFAVPVMLGNILQLTYNLVDTKIVSQVLGERSLAAVGSTNSLYTLVIGFLQGLTNGFAVLAAQYFGAGDIKTLKRTVALALKYGAAVSLLLTTLVLVFLRPLLLALNTPGECIEQAYDYIWIVFAGMTVLMLYNVCCALLRAIGDSFTPLIFLGISVTLNIAGDYLFMAVIPWGVSGAAISTVLSQLIAMAACFAYMFIKYPILRVSGSDFKNDSVLLGKMMATGCSMGFMSCLVSIGTVVLQGAINSFGQEIIVAHSTARRITELFMMMFGVLGTTMATFCGQNLGAGHIDRIKKGIKISVFIGWIWCGLMVALSYTIVPAFVKLLISSDNKYIIETASLYLRIDSLLYFVTAVITIIRNAMQGIGDRITPLVSSSIELVGKVLVVIILVPVLGYMGVILAEPIVWVFMVIPLIVQIIRNPLLKKSHNSTAD
ncbi:MAG: MATE family efflux transporter [Eubacteriales bacterium]|nr:MATE family efflux transporter [Eubacteriales bacterium]